MHEGLHLVRVPEGKSLAWRIGLPLREGRVLGFLGQPYDLWICTTEASGVKELILHKEPRSLEENHSDTHEKRRGNQWHWRVATSKRF